MELELIIDQVAGNYFVGDKVARNPVAKIRTISFLSHQEFLRMFEILALHELKIMKIRKPIKSSLKYCGEFQLPVAHKNLEIVFTQLLSRKILLPPIDLRVLDETILLPQVKTLTAKAKKTFENANLTPTYGNLVNLLTIYDNANGSYCPAKYALLRYRNVGHKVNDFVLQQLREKNLYFDFGHKTNYHLQL